ncbi:MAG: hypothetical protein ABIM29_04440 [candidate division WOR-3 bacterium]
MLTFGFEWEIFVLNTKLLPLQREETLNIAYNLRKKIRGTHTGCDFMIYFPSPILEIRSGIMKSLRESEEILEKIFEEIKKLRKNNLIFLFSGTYPFSGDTAGFHVHIGSFYSFKESFEYERSLINYIPLLGAISANSSIYTKYIYGNYKSYRILFHAWWASRPNRYEIEKKRFFEWGTDLNNKLIYKPTIEIRIGDAPIFKDFIMDYLFLCLGFFLLNDEEFNEKRYREYLINRLIIAKNGLQSKILWNGKEENIDDVLLNKISKIEDKLSKKFNYKFKIVPEMIEKRRNMADFSYEIFKKENMDILNYILRVNDAFFENGFLNYLRNSKKLEILKSPTPEEIFFEFTKGKSALWRLSEISKLPLLEIEKIIENLKKKRKIKIFKDKIYGILISRND